MYVTVIREEQSKSLRAQRRRDSVTEPGKAAETSMAIWVDIFCMEQMKQALQVQATVWENV